MGEIELEPGEEVIEAVRKHVFVLLLSLLPFAFLAWIPSLVPIVFAFIAHATPDGTLLPYASVLTGQYARLLYGLYLLVIWSAVFNTITLYYLNEWIITTTRIIEIHQYGYFSREVSSLLLIKVQDVNINVDGIFGTVISYGQLEVQSAGTAEHFIMDDIPRPEHLRDVIMREIAALHADGRTTVGGSVAGSL